MNTSEEPAVCICRADEGTSLFPVTGHHHDYIASYPRREKLEPQDSEIIVGIAQSLSAVARIGAM
jgi:hypothetical protein